jgi:hypothetical protein
MKVPPGLHVEWVENEAIVLDAEGSQLHYLNQSAALVWALIAESGYEPALERLSSLYPDSQLEADLPTLLADMKEKGLLVDD